MALFVQNALSEISVIIPTYNYGRFIAQAIDGAMRQTLVPNEIIVVDDGSTDDTETVVRGFGDRVKYIWQENAGVCAARNRGVEESTGDVLSFLDSDDFFEPTLLEKEIDKLLEDPKIGFVHCGVREFDSDSGKTVGLQIEGAEEEIARNLLLWEEPGYGHGIMVKRKAFDQVGGFDQKFVVSEDWDFCYRVARICTVRFVPEPLYHYRIHDSGSHFNVDALERSMQLFYEKAFDTDNSDILRLKRLALGNYHKVIAGSYLQSGIYRKFLSHFSKSIYYRPSHLSFYIKRFFVGADKNSNVRAPD